MRLGSLRKPEWPKARCEMINAHEEEGDETRKQRVEDVVAQETSAHEKTKISGSAPRWGRDMVGTKEGG